MVDRRDVELAVRVKDLASAPFQEVARAVESLTSALGEQVEQARTGKASVGELRESLDRLRQAEAALVSQQGLIDRLRKEFEAATRLTMAMREQEKALTDHAAKRQQAGVSAAAWERENRRLETQLARTRREAESAESKFQRYRAALQAAGIDVQNLGAAQQQLVNVAAQVGQSKTALSAAVSGYARNLRLARQEAKALADAEREAAAAGAAAGAASGGQGASWLAGRRRMQGRGGETGLFGLRGFELQNLGYQVNDVVTQLAGGTGIGQVIGQQGGQIVQVFNKNLFDLIAMIPRYAVAIAGATAVTLGFVRAVSDQSSIKTFRADLASTTSGLAYQAEQLSQARRAVREYGVSWSDAGEAIRAAVAAGVNQDRLPDLLRTSQIIAGRTGGQTPDVMSSLVQGLSGGYDTLLKLNQQYQFLDANSAAAIKRMFDEGRQAEANAAAYEILAAKQKAAADILEGPWVRALREVQALYDRVASAIADSLVIDAATAAWNGLATAIGSVARVLRQIGSMPTVGAAEQLSIARGELAGLPDLQRQYNLSDEDVSRTRQSLEAYIKQLEARVAAAPRTGGLLTNATTSDQLRLDREIGRLTTSAERAGGLTQARELELAVAERLSEMQNAGLQVTEEGVRLIREKVKAEFDAADAARLQSDYAKRALDYARDQRTAEQEKARFFREQAESSAKIREDAEARIKLAGQKARETLFSRAGEFVSEAELDAAQRNAESLAREEIDKAARRSAASAASTQANQALALQNQLAALARSGGNTGLMELEDRLARIDDQFESLARNVAKFRAAGGTAIGGKTVGEFESDAKAVADKAKAYESIKYQESELVRLIQERNSLVQTNNALHQAGAITQAEAADRIREAYAKTAPQIMASADEMERLVRAAQAAGSVTPVAADSLLAKLQQFRAEATYVNPLAASLRQNVEGAFSNAVVSGVQDVTKAMADLAAGTAKTGDVFKAFGSAAMRVLGDVASSIATTILKYYALRAIESSGVGSWFGKIFGAVASGATAGIGASSSFGGLGFGPNASSAGFTVMHTGGIVGHGGGPSRNVSPWVFVDAPRMHSGGLVGLAPDEQAIIARRGEEVLTETDPRHRSNGGGSMTLRNVLVMDPEAIPAAMTGAAGERVVLTVLQRNAAAVRRMIG